MRNDIDANYGTADPISMQDPQYGNANININFPYAVINRQEQTGLYIQDQSEWNKWVLTLGGRYDFAKTSTYTRSTSSLDEINDQQFTGEVALIICSITVFHLISVIANPSSQYLERLKKENHLILLAVSSTKQVSNTYRKIRLSLSLPRYSS